MGRQVQMARALGTRRCAGREHATEPW